MIDIDSYVWHACFNTMRTARIMVSTNPVTATFIRWSNLVLCLVGGRIHLMTPVAILKLAVLAPLKLGTAIITKIVLIVFIILINVSRANKVVWISRYRRMYYGDYLVPLECYVSQHQRLVCLFVQRWLPRQRNCLLRWVGFPFGLYYRITSLSNTRKFVIRH